LAWKALHKTGKGKKAPEVLKYGFRF